MSYILDALKRADAERERERGGVPRLGDPVLSLGEDEDAPRRKLPLWMLLLLGVSVVVLGGSGLGWWLSDRAPTPQGRVVAHGPKPSIVIEPPPDEAPVVASAPLSGRASAAVDSARKAPPRETPRATDMTAPEPVPSARPAPPAPERNRASRNLNTSVNKTEEALPKIKASPPMAPAASEPQVYRTAELPESIRQALPKLTLGGAMYSDKPTNRMLIVNGQVFHEGDTVASGLTLIQIRLKDALLEFQGYRYEVTY